MHSEKHPTSKHRTFKETGTTTICLFGHLVLRNALVDPFEKTPVLVVVELIWFLFLNMLSLNFIQTPNKSRRFRKFRRSNAHRSVVAQTNYCQNCTAFFLLDVRCPKCPHSFSCSCLSPTIVHLRNLFLLSTPVA